MYTAGRDFELLVSLEDPDHWTWICHWDVRWTDWPLSPALQWLLADQRVRRGENTNEFPALCGSRGSKYVGKCLSKWSLWSAETRVGPLHFQAGCRRRWLNLTLVFSRVFCVVVRLFWLLNVCCYCVRFSFSIPRQQIAGLWNDLFCVKQGCSLGLDVSVSRRSRDVVSKRLSLFETLEGLDLVSDWKSNVSVSSRSRTIGSRLQANMHSFLLHCKIACTSVWMQGVYIVCWFTS